MHDTTDISTKRVVWSPEFLPSDGVPQFVFFIIERKIKVKSQSSEGNKVNVILSSLILQITKEVYTLTHGDFALNNFMAVQRNF